ncbi:MAG: hypothetical protein K0U41_06940 [Gammaproteobacteria bacterium]|nr:hypothetical protein [Gammaproteobacteria bacterium]
MLILLEGPDRTGKTTLAKHLAEVFSLNYIHCSKPKTDDPFKEYIGLLDSIKEPTVLDRGHLGEYVYSKLWRGGQSLSNSQFAILDKKFMSKFDYTLVIHCDAAESVIRERCIKCGEDLLDLKDIQRCRDLFDHVLSSTLINRIYYPSDKQRPEDISKKMCEEMKWKC